MAGIFALVSFDRPDSGQAQARWNGEDFVVMSGSLALAKILFTPWSVLLPGQSITHYVWGTVFLAGAVGIWYTQRRHLKFRD